MVEDYKTYVVTDPQLLSELTFNRYTSTITLLNSPKRSLSLTAMPEKKFDNDH
jgi:hypothetical protein